jgi:hypothetical protein
MAAAPIVVDPFDGPEIAMLAVAVISAASSIAGAIIANRGRQHAQAARVQVENNHSTNMREEADERHAENVKALKWIAQRVNWLTDMAIGNRSRIRDLESTQPPTRRGQRKQEPEHRDPPTTELPLIYSDIPGRSPWDEYPR